MHVLRLIDHTYINDLFSIQFIPTYLPTVHYRRIVSLNDTGQKIKIILGEIINESKIKKNRNLDFVFYKLIINITICPTYVYINNIIK